MEIDVTDYINGAEHCVISASRMEMGDNAARITWENAKQEAASVPFLATKEECDGAREWLGEFGAWSDEELSAMADQEIRALILQFISGDVREAESLAPGDGPGGIDWEEYRPLQEAGTCSSNLYLGDDGRVYFYIGS